MVVSAWPQTGPVRDGQGPCPYFRITVVDEATGSGIPAVRLKTTDSTEYWADSAGVIAYYAPDLMGTEVYFEIETFGYSYPADGFGFRGVRLKPVPGGSARVKMKRQNIAQRLYRMTGTGIYRDSLLLGDSVPDTGAREGIPVTGQDGGVVTPVYKGRLFWIYGDTNLPRYPLGEYQTVCATSTLQRDGLDPEVGIPLHYFRNENGEARGMVDMKIKPIWLGSARVIYDQDHGEHLVALYMNGFESDQTGLVEFDDRTESFKFVTRFPDDPIITSQGNAFRYREAGAEYFGFSGCLGNVRCPTDLKSAQDLSDWEALTCLKPGSRFSRQMRRPEFDEKGDIIWDSVLRPAPGKDERVDQIARMLDRDGQGRLRWSWRRDTSPIGETEMRALEGMGLMKPQEQWYRLTDADTGKEILSQDGTINWNDYRKRWINIRLEILGDSNLGEVWYFEGDTPQGPWVYGTKIVTHCIDKDNTYTFYLPTHHPPLDKDGGRKIFFTGSFTAGFSNAHHEIPLYEYNEFLYMLELDDPRLFLPVPVYRVDAPVPVYHTRNDIVDSSSPRQPLFFAPDRPRKGTIPIYESFDTESQTSVLTTDKGLSGNQKSAIAFYAISVDAPDATTDTLRSTTPLYEFTNPASGRRLYATDPETIQTGFKKTEAPICRVWPNPIQFNPYELAPRNRNTGRD